jgi:hypothetical protein
MKILLSTFLLLMGMLGLTNCGSNQDCPTVLDLDIDLWVRDKSGNNLLDPKISTSFKKDSIRVFYLEDGQRKEFYNPNLDAPRGFFIYKNEGNGEYVFRIFSYEGKSKVTERTTIYVQWRQGIEDAFECEMTKVCYSVYCTKVWYNGVLKYDDATAKTFQWGNGNYKRFIEIKK